MLATAHCLHPGSDLHFSSVLGSPGILAPRHGTADGLGGMELSQVAMPGSPNPLGLDERGGEEGRDTFLWATGETGCRRGEAAASQWRKELPGQISQTSVRLQSNLSDGTSQREKTTGGGKTQTLPFCTHLHVVVAVTKGKRNCFFGKPHGLYPSAAMCFWAGTPSEGMGLWGGH